MRKTLVVVGVFLFVAAAWLPASAQFTVTTIANIQNGLHTAKIIDATNPGGVGTADSLEITGIVSAGGTNHVYVQEAAAVRSGIRCYGGSFSTTGINIGDDVTVQAEYLEYYGESELDFSATGGIVVNSTGNPPYAALTIPGSSLPYDAQSDTTPAEDYEAVLVRVTNVEITDDSSNRNTPGTSR